MSTNLCLIYFHNTALSLKSIADKDDDKRDLSSRGPVVGISAR